MTALRNVKFIEGNLNRKIVKMMNFSCLIAPTYRTFRLQNDSSASNRFAYENRKNAPVLSTARLLH